MFGQIRISEEGGKKYLLPQFQMIPVFLLSLEIFFNHGR